MSSDEDISDFEGLNDPNEVADDIGSRDENAELSTRERPAYTSSEISSLYDLSLQSISHNLERYNLAFSTTEDIYFRRNLQFLQRRHSPYLISRQLVNGYLDESYWQFLINEYVTELNVGILANGNYDAAIARIAEVGHAFQKIHLKFLGCGNRERNVRFMNSVVSRMPNVELLDLCSQCTDETLEIISSSCLNLKNLILDKSFVTNVGLKYLCQEKKDGVATLKLKMISLDGKPGVTVGIVYLLQNMPSLEEIIHEDLNSILYVMHKDDLSNPLRLTYNLTSINLKDIEWNPCTTATDILSVWVDVCPRIKKVFISHATRKDLELVSKLSELEQLHIYGLSPCKKPHFSSFLNHKGETLRILEIEGLYFSVDILMQSCPKLEVLNLKSIFFESPKSSLKPLNHLVSLNFDGYSLTDDTYARLSLITVLSFSPKLEYIRIGACKFAKCIETLSSILKICENSSTLKFVTFFKCDVEEAFLKAILSTSATLKSLVLEACYRIGSCEIANLRETSRSLQSGVIISWKSAREYYGFCDLGESSDSDMDV